MRCESTVTSLGWIPSEAIEGMIRPPIDIGVGHYDPLVQSNPTFRKLEVGGTITEQGKPGDELFLIVDGVFDVEVDGKIVAEVGPGAIVGERAILEGGLRSSTVRARTAARVALQSTATADADTLATIASGHRAEEV